MNFYGFNPEISCPFLGDQHNFEPSFPNYNHQISYDDNRNSIHNVSAQIEHPPFDECQIVPLNLGSLLPNDPLDLTQVPEIPDTCFNYINDLLREEYYSPDDHLDTPNSTLEDYMAAQMSYNKSLDAALNLGENFPIPFSSNTYRDHHQCPPPGVSETNHHCLDDYLNMFSGNINNSNTSTVYFPQSVLQSSFVNNDFGGTFVSSLPLVESSLSHGVDPVPTPGVMIDGGGGGGGGGGGESDHLDEAALGFMMNNALLQAPLIGQSVGNSEASICRNSDHNNGENNNNSRRRKHDEGNGKEQEGNGDRRNKQLAPSNDVVEQIEQYGEVILCPEGRSKPGALCKTKNSGDSSKKRGNKGRQVVDLRGLLTRCAQCIAQVNLNGAYEMIKQIREHSSPYGDFLQRVAHYLANGLEARLEGKGLELSHANEEISASEVLKANRIYVASVPFQIMSYYTMNKTIAGLVMEAPSIHIIDFGIYYGLQWPCIIQNLSKRPNGPPRIRITGIDFPQRGFRPSERVEETGRCLAKYCEKYNVPFEYYPISKNWEDVKLEELKIDRNEPLVVNCLYRAHLLFDESVEENSPRDAFLKLVRKINPDIFMHAVLNSTSSVPFFLNRFKEVMFHYSALFDIFESTMMKEDSERLLLESKLYGPEALNVIACEGMERVERPESYKQWQIRTQRAGFEQLGLDRELLRKARAMVRTSFRQEFSYDVDAYWVVQGWKGRILYAISCWKPT
ncbi:scarecrow-like protein 30 [Spinacia oleracea]|uniref:Scarecrow-like protein 30 n=1 Tax=Spinacia oleracea TaxID=3562 RepID=A0A9R0J9Z7_SPIOL|nr:scarecrow-like protein 30 [Spinacia oleracea]